MRARAFCPGHVTGFFEVHRAEDSLSTGSRGAGFCTTLGATSDVSVQETDEVAVSINVNGESREADVTRSAVERMVAGRGLCVTVDTILELPESQGFGMSAAGALSASVALAELLGLDRQEAFEAAHYAEIKHGGGLGDVPALHRAGITIREVPGLPPKGRVDRIDEELDIIIAVVGPPMRTSQILNDAESVARINRSGHSKVERLLAEPTAANLVHLSSQFAIETDLAQGRVREAMEAAEPAGRASMVMLGNSVFAIGRTQELVSTLSGFGEVRRCGVDNVGPRLL